jgi:16S rRNA (guanine527-N7)-methyltransferase
MVSKAKNGHAACIGAAFAPILDRPAVRGAGLGHQLERKTRLLEGLVALKMERGEAVVEPLLAYLTELEQWNRAYNLTAVRDPLEMVSRHLLDSLSILPWLSGERLLDVGAGAGLPGIPLAIAEPKRQWVLLDSNGKKARFLRHVVRTLGLDNVSVIEDRIEAYRPDDLPDCITARALAALPQLLSLLTHLCPAGGRVLAMKGRLSEQEHSAVEPPFQLIETRQLSVPGLDSERNLIVIERQ